MTTAPVLIESAASIKSIDQLQDALREHNYIADRGLATAIYLALKLRRPLFLEGEAGVGKTDSPSNRRTRWCAVGGALSGHRWWDRHPKPTAGRLRRQLMQVDWRQVPQSLCGLHPFIHSSASSLPRARATRYLGREARRTRS
jgi:hypothetical protein